MTSEVHHTEAEPDADVRAATDPRRLTSAEQETLSAARLLALDRMPYLASALFDVVPVRSPELDTFAVDARWRLYLGPSALARWSVPEVAAVLLHEVGHLLRDHHARHAEQPRPDGLRWNLAADAEINDDLLAAQVPLPGRPVTPASLGAADGQLAEWYFAHLLDEHDPAPDPACGSGAGGDPLPVELAEDAAEHPGRGPLEQELVRRAVAQEIAGRRRAAGNLVGTIPGGWRRWAEHVLAPPAIDWRQRLRRNVRRSLAVTAGRLDTSYQRPGRRRLPRVVTPGQVQPRIRIGVVVDTSSSMLRPQLEAALAELDGLCRHAGIGRDDRVVVSADIEVHEVHRLRAATDLPLIGGGGTDLRPAIAHLVRHRLQPGTLIILTDGFTPWPVGPPTGRRVIAVLIARRDGLVPAEPPEWLETIRVQPND